MERTKLTLSAQQRDVEIRVDAGLRAGSALNFTKTASPVIFVIGLQK
jgi:hypothetical protein